MDIDAQQRVHHRPCTTNHNNSAFHMHGEGALDKQVCFIHTVLDAFSCRLVFGSPVLPRLGMAMPTGLMTGKHPKPPMELMVCA